MVALVIGLVMVAWYTDLWWWISSYRLLAVESVFWGSLLIRLGLC